MIKMVIRIGLILRKKDVSLCNMPGDYIRK